MTRLAKRAWACGREGRGTRFYLGGICLVLGSRWPHLAWLGIALVIWGIGLQLSNREKPDEQEYGEGFELMAPPLAPRSRKPPPYPADDQLEEGAR